MQRKCLCKHCKENYADHKHIRLCRDCYQNAEIRDKYRTAIKRSGAPCRHCKAPKAWASRGLCFVCYRKLDIRNLYPPIRNCAPVGGPINYRGVLELPPAPVSYQPGSAEKIAAMEARAHSGKQIFHPQDFGARY